MTKRFSTAICILALPFGLMACGKDCQSTCTKLYGSGDDCGDPKGDPESDNYIPGLLGSVSRSEKTSDCMNACNNGLSKPGEVGDYDPYKEIPPAKVGEDALTLENDQQVALWMECVDEHSCEKIAEGFCKPIW